MNSWKVIRFDPFTHEVTSLHRPSGETIRFVIPPEYRTVEKSCVFVDSMYKKHTRQSEAAAVHINVFQYLFMFAAGVLILDLLLRVYGI